MVKEKRQRKRIPKAERRNMRLWAEGARETILLPHIDGYTTAMDEGWRAERAYLKKVCNEFHARETLPDDEEAVKSAKISEINERIRRWFKYRIRKLRSKGRLSRGVARDAFAELSEEEQIALGARAKASAAEKKKGVSTGLEGWVPPRRQAIDRSVLIVSLTSRETDPAWYPGSDRDARSAPVTDSVSYGRNNTASATHFPQWTNRAFSERECDQVSCWNTSQQHLALPEDYCLLRHSRAASSGFPDLGGSNYRQTYPSHQSTTTMTCPVRTRTRISDDSSSYDGSSDSDEEHSRDEEGSAAQKRKVVAEVDDEGKGREIGG
ncbi:hypothetical protein B0H11DRAFT_2238182 [Mycena galericulata]|nr:hypothetical protein B0H11DRAFT_2238182 [Mycena galericulata]